MCFKWPDRAEAGEGLVYAATHFYAADIFPRQMVFLLENKAL